MTALVLHTLADPEVPHTAEEGFRGVHHKGPQLGLHTEAGTSAVAVQGDLHIVTVALLHAECSKQRI